MDGSERATSPSDDVRAGWETNAEWSDAHSKEGKDFHRPLRALLEPFFRSGSVLDGLEQTSFTDPSEPRGPLSWDRCPEIPPVIVARRRPPRRR